MVSQQDIRSINAQREKMGRALGQIAALHRESQKDGVTVESSAYAASQQDVKAAVADLWVVVDDMIDQTDTFDADDGSTLSLPESALNRDSNASTNPPEDPK